MLKNRLNFLTLFLFILNVSHAIALTAPTFTIENFLESQKQVLQDISSKDFSSDLCTDYLRSIEEQILNLDVRLIPEHLFKKRAKAIVDLSWEIRKVLHSRLSLFNKECVYQIQSNFKQFRFIEDYLLEKLVNVKDMIPDGVDFQKEPVPMMEEAPFYVFQKGYEVKDVYDAHGGDLYISRGLSFLSAMIARLGKRGTQFSHVVFVHEEDNESNPDKRLGTIESYVGSGVGFYDFKYALKNENARILWLRPQNELLASKADKFSAEYFKKHKIHYDYELDFLDHKTMSCAEVSQFAYESVDPDFKIPMYPNVISGAQSLLDHIGIKPGVTYEPGDMEIDPRFDLMGEFRDLRLTRDSRQKDAILSEMFRWMDEYDYVLKDNFKSNMAGGPIYTLRHSFLWPLVKRGLKLDDFSKEIPRKMIRTVTLLRDLGAVLLKEVRAKDLTFEKETGWKMTYKELYKVLEDFRKKDLALYLDKKTRKKSEFHRWFHPKKKKS